MNRSLRIYFMALLLLIVVVFLIDSGRKKPLNWSPTYMLDDKIPLGLYVLDHEIDSLFQGNITRYHRTPYEYFQQRKQEMDSFADSIALKEESDHQPPKETFLMIGNSPLGQGDQASIEHLLKRVEKGSTLFFSAKQIPWMLIDTLGVDWNFTYLEPQIGKKDTIRLSLTHPEWKKQYLLSPAFGQQRFSKLDTATTSVLGFMHFPDSSKYLSFIKIRLGEGSVFLHTQPAVFSNYSLLSTPDLSEYASQVLSYLPNNEPVIWFVKGQMKSGKATTALSVIFRYPSLRALWQTFLYGMILFIFFRAKRRQRVIPIIKPLHNTTVEFAKTIGNLYYQEGDVGNIVQKKILYFLDRVRNRYYIDTEKIDDAFIEKLCLKSGKNKKLIQNIVHFIRWYGEKRSANETDLIRLNEFIEDFWENK